MIKKKSKDKHAVNRRDFLKTVTGTGIGTVFGFSILSDINCKPNSPGIPKRLLGRTKLSVSVLGFGSTQVKNKAVYQRAVELGVNYFHMGDSDPVYNLEACAALLPFRKQIHIAYMSYPKASQTILLEDLDNYLQQSGFGHLDIWFVMTPRPEVLSEFKEAVTIARKAGKIRWAGITTHGLDQDITHLTLPESPIDVVMITYNYLSSPDDSNNLDMLYNAGLGITPMKPLAGRFYENTVKKPDALLRWLAADERIHTFPVIMNTIEQVEQNVAAVKQSLSEEDRELLRTMVSYNSRNFCRMCGTCEGKCPKGLAISDLVRTAMYLEGYRDVGRARSSLLLIPEKRRQISCHKCDNCSVLCPNGVDIRSRICRIRDWRV
ncbi:MAG: aldo/keto reductase [Bacteroidales bacterium]|nr:MAG: aldo/keto reductase [Bacteroidales bacterium]